MRTQIEHKHADGERRIITRFLFWPTTLLLPPRGRTPYIQKERRWLERANIEQFYSHMNTCWINIEWADVSNN